MISGQWVAFVMNNWKLREAKHFRVCVAIYHDIKLHGRMHTVSVTRGYECLMLIGTGNSCNLGREGRLVTCSLTHNLNILHTKDIKREKTAKDCLQLQQPIENLTAVSLYYYCYLLDTLSTNTIQASPFSSQTPDAATPICYYSTLPNCHRTDLYSHILRLIKLTTPTSVCPSGFVDRPRNPKPPTLGNHRAIYLLKFVSQGFRLVLVLNSTQQ